MSIFLVGGGPDSVRSSVIYEEFAREVQGQAAECGRLAIAALVLFDHEGSGDYFLPGYQEPLERYLECETRVIYVREGEPVEPSEFREVDAIVVGGGPTPAYLEGLRPAAEAIRAAVDDGVTYLGYSAGAMIAPTFAIVGGYMHEERQVCPEEWSEGLGHITIAPGLGLTRIGIEVHAAQGGTLGRAISAVHAGLLSEVAAIDEDTALILDQNGMLKTGVVGSGSVWAFTENGEGTSVTVSSGV